jgi:hypothetical protein
MTGFREGGWRGWGALGAGADDISTIRGGCDRWASSGRMLDFVSQVRWPFDAFDPKPSTFQPKNTSLSDSFFCCGHNDRTKFVMVSKKGRRVPIDQPSECIRQCADTIFD